MKLTTTECLIKIAHAAKCDKCSSPAVRTRGGRIYCAMHDRMFQMRYDAQQKGKSVPSMLDLQQLIEALLDSGMRCECCKRVMNWLRRDGKGTVVTLQHDRSGAFRLICFACNTRHFKHPGDSYYDIPQGCKKCFGCHIIKKHSEFYMNRSARNGMQAYCKRCQLERQAKRPLTCR